jgi:hypothetical protein
MDQCARTLSLWFSRLEHVRAPSALSLAADGRSIKSGLLCAREAARVTMQHIAG